jgi:cold shock CspA family protein
MIAEVKSLNSRMYGFLTAQDGQEYFFHASSLAAGISWHDLSEGDQVEFDVVTPQPVKGPRAANIRAERDEASAPVAPAADDSQG